MDIKEIMDKSLSVLRNGGVLLYPTDTVWGIGCDATDPEAVAKVYALKKRSDSKSLVLLASDLDMVGRFIKEIPEIAIQLVEVNDQPMTIIYPVAVAGERPMTCQPGSQPTVLQSTQTNTKTGTQSRNKNRYELAWNTVAEDGSVGMRIPMADFCRDLVKKFGRPIVSTSANISGEPTPKKFADIAPEIVSGVDYAVPSALEAGSTGRSSSIIKVGLDASIEIIRK